MDPASSGAGGAPLQNISPTTDPAELREIIVRQDLLIRAFQAQLEALTAQLPRRGNRRLLALMEIRQGSDSAADYAIRFRTLAAQSEWNDAALWAVFRAGLNSALQTELACHVEATSLSQFVATAIRLDNLQRQRRTGASDMASARPRVRMDCPGRGERDPEPMQLGRSRLTEEERQPRGPPRWCYNCGSTGHLSPRCPERAADSQVGDRSLFMSLTIPVSLLFSDRCVRFPALIDSGAAVNLIDGALVKELGISTSPCVPSLRITAIDSQPIGEGYLRRQTEPLGLQVGLFHHERLTFYITSSPANPVILGFPWLRRHDPQISWRTGELTRWSPACLRNCLRNPVSRSCGTCSVEEVDTGARIRLPQPYTDFERVFSEERASHLPEHQEWDCGIDLLPNTSLPKGRIYPLSLPESKAMEDYIEGALAAGHIRPSTSPAAAGFFFVEKKDGGLRPCIDYRGLNAITVRYPYPLPLVPAALEQLRGARLFTKLDLRSAYNLIRIRKGDEWKTAFHTTHGHYEYCVMPFGLTNAPAVFQALINGVFRDLLGRGVIAYIDDILVYSTSMEEHVCQVREVLARLQRFHLFVKLEKCEFHRTTVTFLGYVISPRGAEMDTNKVRAVSEWPAPDTIKELQRFLGFTNFYRRFIRSYSSVAAPLTSLLRGKPKKLNWTDQARAAFQRLKDCFTSAPILCHPDPDKPFVVEVDASSSGLGAVLFQRHGNPGKVHPCAFYSRKLTTAEVNYDVGNRELLAIKAALDEWCHWLEGARHPFQVLTDHRNLEYLRGAKRLNPRQARWALFFTRFQFTVSYRPGSKNGKADALSRQSEGAGNLGQPELILPATTLLAPVRWDLLGEIRRAHAEEPPPSDCPPRRLFVPSQFRTQVMRWVHEAPSSGHPGTRRSAQLVSRQFWWPSLGSDVEDFVRQCATCAQAWTSRQRPEGLLEPLPVPRRPWSHLSVDFLTDLPDSGGFTAIMVVVDRFSKGCKLVPLKGLPTAMQTADAMFTHVFRNFGLPEDIVSDRGPQFTSRVWRALCARLDIGVSLSSSHHPQSNGQAERLNQEIGRFLRSYCSREQQRWSEFLPWAEYAQNSLMHSSTGLTPFQCVLGYQPPLFPWSGEPSSVPAVEEWYRRSQEVWERAHVRLQRAVRRQRIQADRHRRPHPAYQVGQMVWLSTRNLRLRLPCRKLSPKFIGPFEIVRQVNPVAYRLRLPASYRICPTFHASLLKPAHASAGESVGTRRRPWTSRGRLLTRCGPCWTPDDCGHVSNTSWTGRDTASRSGQSGDLLSEPTEICKQTVSFYSKLYSSEWSGAQVVEDSFLVGLPKLSERAARELDRELLLEELHEALQRMENGRASGIDSLPAEFYKAFWAVIGQDMLDVLRDSIWRGELPLSCRRAVLTMLPKKGDLTHLKNWRPVSLLCTDCKLLSKALASRLTKGNNEFLNKNWEDSVEQVLEALVPKMSYRGRMLVINNLTVLSLWHKLACVDPPPNLLANIQAQLVDFFWDGLHWIPQSALHLPKEEEGQGLVQLSSRAAVFRLQFIQRLLTGTRDLVWRAAASGLLRTVKGLGLDRALFLMDTKMLDISGLPMFYCGLFKIWNVFKKQNKGYRTVHWLLEEPLVYGGRLDISGVTVPALSRTLVSSGIVMLR
ncbi:hypothetical protein QTP86_024496 [Hemibagrus guttatus]|nr:hypothetical protein QTP86_024496 [Hemibagrus guttatus]